MKRKSLKERFTTYFVLKDACREGGCPVCWLLNKSIQRYLENLLYENVNDGGTRTRLRGSLGFCRRHGSLLVSIGDNLGTSIIYEDILRHILDTLDKSVKNGFSPARCPVCELRQRRENDFISTLAGHIADPELRESLDQSRGLCLHHLGQLRCSLTEESSRAWLLNLHHLRLDLLRHHLSEYSRKQDVQFRAEQVTEEEQNACNNAIDFLIGTSG